MSKERDQNIKSDLNKHINSKLFKRFLENKALKKPENNIVINKLPLPFNRKSPERIKTQDSDSSEQEISQSPFRVLNKSKSMSIQDQFLPIKKISPIVSRKISPLRDTNFLNLDLPTATLESYESPLRLRSSLKNRESSASPNHVPIYTVDPLLLKQYETNQSQLEYENERLKKQFDETIQQKNNEIKRLQKNIEKLRARNSELVEKNKILEDSERKIAIFKSERENLERKIHNLENDLDTIKRQLEYARSDIENYKTQSEENEKNYRKKTIEFEKDIQMAKIRFDDAEKNLLREKERNDQLG